MVNTPPMLMLCNWHKNLFEFFDYILKDKGIPHKCYGKQTLKETNYRYSIELAGDIPMQEILDAAAEVFTTEELIKPIIDWMKFKKDHTKDCTIHLYNYLLTVYDDRDKATKIATDFMNDTNGVEAFKFLVLVPSGQYSIFGVTEIDLDDDVVKIEVFETGVLDSARR